jgi:2-amino-4-hydroxy-6-hydroxymethyldihydropteridine diphosphokinase
MNATVALETGLEPQELLDGLLAIEQEFGRDRAAGFANGPRTLDLDILLLGDLEIREPGLVIPHPRLAERAFVLVPLCEIAAEVVVPGRGLTVEQLFARWLQGQKNESDAVVRVQSDAWLAR